MSVVSQFLEPPRLRTVEEQSEDRRATWLELFFDLVFVVAVAELGLNLTTDPTFHGLLVYAGLFVPVWWAWAGFTFYANRFDTDDLVYRLLTLAAMFAVAALAANVPGVPTGASTGFAISYVGVRAVLILLYARALRYVEPARPLARLYLSFFGAAIVVWLISLAVDPPGRYGVWAVALALELTAPIFGWRRIPRAPIDVRHLPERYGLLTIIVLGESVLAVVLGVANVSWSVASALAAAAGFLAAAALWWIYFEYLDASMVRRGIFAGLVFTYAHFFVVAGIAALGVGVKLEILSAGGNGRYDDTTWIFCAGLAAAMLGLAAIQLATPPAVFDADVWLRLATAAGALVLLAASFSLPVLVVVWLLSGLLVVQVGVELARHSTHVPGKLDEAAVESPHG